MGKYLHHYETTFQFEGNYKTENTAVVSFECSAGTFTYDRYKFDQENGGMFYVYKNGNVELYSSSRTFSIDDNMVFDPVNNVDVTLTSIVSTEPAIYHTPWVSYTKDYNVTRFNATLSNETLGQTKTDQTYVLEKEVETKFLK